MQQAGRQQLVERVGKCLLEQVADRVGEVEQVEIDRLGVAEDPPLLLGVVDFERRVQLLAVLFRSG